MSLSKSYSFRIILILLACFQAHFELFAKVNIIEINEFCFNGNITFSDDKLSSILSRYTNRQLETWELEEARLVLTRFYVEKGYVNSGAILESQSPENGIICFNIIEGKISEIQIDGAEIINESFYKKRLQKNGGNPLNINQINDTLRYWRIHYPLDRINAELYPGALPGEALLNVKIRENKRFNAGLRIHNQRSPSTGGEQAELLLRSESLTGRYDRAYFSYGFARDGNNGIDYFEADDFSAEYHLPLAPNNLELGLHYSQSSSSVIEETFEDLDIASRFKNLGVSLRLPVIQNPNKELSFSITGRRKKSESFLLGQPFSFSTGSDNGKQSVSTLDFAGHYAQRNDQSSWSIGVGITQGLNLFNATLADPVRDATFTKISAQFFYLSRVKNTSTEIAFKMQGQWTDDRLLSLEQMAVGGMHTVRGYRENTLVRDRGIAASMEVRIPILKQKDGVPLLRFVPFADFGLADNLGEEATNQSFDDISSIGAGFILNTQKHLNLNLFWGHSFRDNNISNKDIQDDGFHFSATLWAF